MERWRALVTRYFGASADEALRVMQGESGGNPNARNPSGATGLFQLTSHHGSLAQRLDPETNIRIAARLHAASGWRAWVIQP